MRKKVFAAVVAILFLATGFSSLAGSEVTGGGVPIITQAFASKEVRPGESWKIYLKASDPNGEMKSIYATVYQPGVGQYPATVIRVKEGNQKELSGYIYLPTFTSWHPMDYANLSVSVQVQDRGGNFSDPVGFLLSLNPRTSQEGPPQGVFKEQELGPIMVRLKTVDGGGGGGEGR